MPAFCLLFGDMIDGVGGANGANSFESLSDSSLLMVYISFGVFIVSFF